MWSRRPTACAASCTKEPSSEAQAYCRVAFSASRKRRATRKRHSRPKRHLVIKDAARFTRSVVMTYLQDMGFHDGSGRERLRTLMLMQEEGEEIVAGGARYLKLAVDDRLELWT